VDVHPIEDRLNRAVRIIEGHVDGLGRTVVRDSDHIIQVAHLNDPAGEGVNLTVGIGGRATGDPIYLDDGDRLVAVAFRQLGQSGC